MDMVPVMSSDLSSVGYDAASRTLYVRFHKGGTYSYSNVPEGVYRGLMNAPSKGRYFRENIRTTYAYRRIG